MRVVAYEGDKPAAFLGEPDFSQYYELFGGQNITGLYRYLRENFSKKALSQNEFEYTLSSALYSLGFIPDIEDIVSQMRTDRKIPWKRVSWDVLLALAQKVAAERNIPLEYFQFTMSGGKLLNGKSLHRLLHYAYRHPEKDEGESSSNFLRRKLGLPEIVTGTRGLYRMKFMKQIFDLQGFTSPGELTFNQLLPWLTNVSKLYASYYYDFEEREVLNEASVCLIEVLEEGEEDPLNLVQKVHTHLERTLREKMLIKKRGVFNPFKDTSRVKNKSKMPRVTVYNGPSNRSTAEHFGIFQEQIEHLSPEQQFLMRAIIVEAWSFDIVAEEFHRKFQKEIDVDEIQEQYDDILIMLRKDLH